MLDSLIHKITYQSTIFQLNYTSQNYWYLIYTSTLDIMQSESSLSYVCLKSFNIYILVTPLIIYNTFWEPGHLSYIHCIVLTDAGSQNENEIKFPTNLFLVRHFPRQYFRVISCFSDSYLPVLCSYLICRLLSCYLSCQFWFTTRRKTSNESNRYVSILPNIYNITHI